MVFDDLEGGVATGELFALGAIGGADNGGTQLLFTGEVIVIDFELDPGIYQALRQAAAVLRMAVGGTTTIPGVPVLSAFRFVILPARPHATVKEHVVAEVFRCDKPKLTVLIDVLDCAQPAALNAKAFLRCVLGRWGFGHVNFLCRARSGIHPEPGMAGESSSAQLRMDALGTSGMPIQFATDRAVARRTSPGHMS